MKNTNTRMTTKKAAAMLAAIAIAPTVMGLLPIATQNSPVGINIAQAQPRFGTPEWDKNRESRRARDYRDNDLSRLSWATIRGTVTSNPSNDLFEFRAENGSNFRVLARSNVSLRDIRRNDRVQVYGKRDGNILIAYSVTKQDNDSGNVENVRARVVDNLSGNRFTIRHNNSNRTVVAERGKPNGLRAGREVELTGRWRNNIFYASNVRLRDDNWGGNWQDGQTRTIRGVATSSLSNRRFTLRMSNNQTINVSTRGSNVFSFSRGDELELTGRWDSRNNIFELSNGRVIRGGGDDFSNGRRVDFEGRVTKAGRVGNAWFFTVRTNRDRDVTVRNSREFRVGDRVRVEGVVQNNVVVASRMSRN